ALSSAQAEVRPGGGLLVRPPACTQGRRNGFPPILATLGALLLLSCTTAAPAAGPTVPPARAVATPAATLVQSAPATTTGATQPATTSPPSGRASEPPWLADYAAAAARLRGDAAEWARLTEAATKEGTVVVAGPGFPGLRTGLTEGFQRAYGITL